MNSREEEEGKEKESTIIIENYRKEKESIIIIENCENIPNRNNNHNNHSCYDSLSPTTTSKSFIINDDDNNEDIEVAFEHRSKNFNNNNNTTTTTTTTNNNNRYWMIGMYASCTIFLFADQNLMAPNLTAIARDFGMTDIERDRKLGGEIALAFWMLGAPASIVVGRLADRDTIICFKRNPRSKLLACTILIGESACFMTYFVRTYSQLFWCRTITGLSVGSAFPLVYSLMGDLFEAHERHLASACVSFGTGFGIALGQGIAGFFGTSNWRLPFVFVSVPALLLATVLYFGHTLLRMDDPTRGSMERAVLLQITQQQQQQPKTQRHQKEEEEDSRNTIQEENNNENDHHKLNINYRRTDDEEEIIITEKEENYCYNNDDEEQTSDTKEEEESLYNSLYTLLKTPSFVLLVLQGGPGCVPWGIINSFLNDYLAQEGGMSVQMATLTLLLFGVSNGVGMLLGGWGGSYLYPKDCRFPPLLCGSMIILGCFPFYPLLQRPDDDNATIGLMAATMSVLAGLFTGIAIPLVKGTTTNVTLPRSRGLAFAIATTFDDVGRGLGPYFVASLIASLNNDRTRAFRIGISFWFLCGVFNLAVARYVRNDEDDIQQRILLLSKQQRRRLSLAKEKEEVIRIHEKDNTKTTKREENTILLTPTTEYTIGTIIQT